MKREDMINRLKSFSPVIVNVTMTFDMGYEFSAVVSEGVIYAEPGMLLSHSGGEWPPRTWENKSEAEYDESLKDFLLGEAWNVTTWEHLSDEEIEEFFRDVIYNTVIHECVEINYLIDTDEQGVTLSTCMENVDNEAISAGEWDSFNKKDVAIPIIQNQWDMIEQILGYAVNDNFVGNFPFEETRFFKKDDDGFLEYSSEPTEIKVKIIINKC